MNVAVIGLENRKDRWERCLEIFKQNGFTKVTRVVTQQDFTDTHRHYMKDFLQLLRLKRHDYLLFFEDDFELVDGWQGVLHKAWQDLPPKWDMLYLGANLTKTPAKVTKNLVRVRGAWFMHATILSPPFMDYILKEYDYNRVKIIDEWYRQQAYVRKFYMTVPMISYQRANYSDFVGKEIDYNIFENKYYKAI